MKYIHSVYKNSPSSQLLSCFAALIFVSGVQAAETTSSSSSSCDAKVKKIASVVGEQALKEALYGQTTEAGKTNSRYLLIGKMGKETQGKLQFVDLKTGDVKTYTMYHGYNDSSAGEHASREMTRSGVVRLNVDANRFGSQHGIYGTNMTKSMGEAPQPFLMCSPQRRSAMAAGSFAHVKHAPCMDPKDMKEVFASLQEEKDAAVANYQKPPEPVMVVYPGDKKTGDKFFARDHYGEPQVKLCDLIQAAEKGFGPKTKSEATSNDPHVIMGVPKDDDTSIAPADE